MSARNPAEFTVNQLKEKLREKGLLTTGNKAELIVRITEADPSGAWMAEISETSETSVTQENLSETGAEAQTFRAGHYEREIEMYRREKELAERELSLLRRELELARGLQQLNIGERERTVDREDISREYPRPSIKAIGDLLGLFDGSGDYEVWEKQLRLLKTTYHLTDEYAKVLVGMRLKGKAAEWLHSKSQHIGLPLETLLSEMREMYDQRPSKVELRKKFEERTWKREETFQQYVHDKVILANRVPISEEEIIDYIIDGIPVTNLRDQARMSRFTSKATLLQAFEKVTLRDRIQSNTKKSEQQKSGDKDQRQRGGEKAEKKNASRNETVRRCYNCGLRDHLSADCPTKDEGPKCFQCGERGHVASKCEKDKKTVRSVHVSARTSCKKYTKEVELNNCRVLALVDTGSDFCLLRSDKYIRLGSPALNPKEIRFRGIGSSDNLTLGEFNANLTIDGSTYPILVRVVSDALLNHELIIGADFLDTVEMTAKAGEISIRQISKPSCVDEKTPEIFQIDLDPMENDKIDVSHIPDAECRNRVKEAITNYVPNESRDVGLKMTIVLKDEEPVYQRPRRLAASEKELVNAQIDEWVRDGIVQPSLSEYASPVVLAKKKDNSIRLCVDYRLLNKKIVKDRYPLPLIEDQLDLLQNAKFFSTLDLKNGFFHVPIDEQSQKYTAFVVPDGHYEFLRVPFGLCNSPAVFQRFINIVFKDLIHDGIVLTYMDDLIIPSEDYKSGTVNLEAVLKVASEAGIIINWRKSEFLKRRVEFLGHIIENGRVYPSERKIEAVRRFPVPNNAKQMQSFLGLSGYFRKFIPRYSTVARPLSDLLKANVKYVFGEKEREAFIRLKEILSSKPVLNLYVTGAETELHTDASMHGYGAILLQRSSEDSAFHPIYYSSGKTTRAEQNYSSYELEVLAIIRALKKFRVYLIGIPFTIVTDCQAFEATMRKKDLCVRVARWALLLEEFNCKVVHRPGRNMSHVDALSRNPISECNTIEEQKTGVTARLIKAQASDSDIKKVFDQAELGRIEGYVVRGGLLFKEVNGNLCIVVPRAMQTQIIRQAHERGHFSIAKTKALLRNDYWIPNVDTKIEKIIKNCVACILAEKKQGKQEGFLNPIAKGEVPLDTYHIDHMGPLPSTKKNYKYVFLVIDAFSKFVWLYATKTTNASEVLDRLTKQSTIFGNPRRIISDRGAAFTSKDFADYCKREGIEHVLITAGIPRANGQAERVNRVLIPLLTKLADPKREEWHKHLAFAQQCINTTLSRSIGTDPFHLLFGVHARLRDDPEIRELLEKEYVEAYKDERDQLRERANESIAKIQRENKRAFDKKRTAAVKYRENDLVAIKRTQQGPGLKFANKYLGPYRIIQVLRNNRYIVQREGEHEGPFKTSTAADYMKPWVHDETDCDSEESDAEN